MRLTLGILIIFGIAYATGVAVYRATASDATIADADFDQDQAVTILDLSAQAAWFTQTVPPAPAIYDLDHDNAVSILDMTIVASYFGESYSVSLTAVPIVTSGLGTTTSMAVMPDGRILVAEKSGALRVIKNGALLATPFLTVSVSTTSERGLIGVALDPGFDSNGYVYVHYTTADSPHGRVARYTAQGDVAASGSALTLIDLDPASSSGNHNGGEIVFGADGKLYIHTGDASDGTNAPSLNTTHGKVLRINPDGSIPTDNPFYSVTSGHHQAIYAKGLRNPFTGAVDPLTGKHFINDVGENGWEEINLLQAGADYGWPACEGPCGPDGGPYVAPLYVYNHTTFGRAITGGAFYETVGYELDGYLFSDYTADWIRRFVEDDTSYVQSGDDAPIVHTMDAPVDLASPTPGALYVLSLFGRVYRLDAVVGP